MKSIRFMNKMRPDGREENEERKSDRAGSDFLEELLAQFFSQIQMRPAAAEKRKYENCIGL